MEVEISLFDPVNKAKSAIASLHAELSDETLSSTLDMAPCGREIITQLQKSTDPSCVLAEARRILNDLEIISEGGIKSYATTQKSVPLHMRRLYTDCRLLHSLIDLQDPAATSFSEEMWSRAVGRLDMTIIVAGAPGEGRLDLILDTIELIQSEHLPLTNSALQSIFPRMPASTTLTSLPAVTTSLAPNPIPRIEPPSLSAFCNRLSSEPFILPGFICDWPALNNHPWRSSAYLQRIAGRGRIVPVEVGSDYRAEEWDQKLMPWEEFLQAVGLSSNMDCILDSEEAQYDTEDTRQQKDIFYLAQHTLLTQFPALRSDVVVPDYVYASLPPSTFPGYRPPNNDERLIINAWLGPVGTVSPAHTDPYFNCFAQVVGRKTIWLAPPRFKDEMYPLLAPHAPHAARETSEDASSPITGTQGSEPSLANTSRVDVFAPSNAHFPLFEVHVRPHALCAVLEPGDMLYIPAGWWHAIRSEDISFSVSMWF